MIKQLILSSILLLLFIGTTEAQSSLFPETPGMVSYTYRNSFQKDVSATLDTLQAMGIKDMEFSNLFGKSATELRALLDERGMHCSSYGVSYQDLMGKTNKVGEDAKTLGAKYVRVAWIPHDGTFDLAAAQKSIADFNAAGKILKDKFDLTFCYHNHGYEFHPHGDGILFDLMIQKTDPNYVSFEMDILWTFFPGADPVYYLEKYGDRFELMHLKDLKKGVEGNLSGGTAVENDVALGTGQLDIPAILIAAKKANVKHYYIEDESPIYYKQVPQSIEYLKNLKK
ncbi:sugar phosphate isomerase/epimerase family protein [Aquiflexum sp.]|uniref:sugar phosphate isomerase/epimerase family protein n=1 Tax=Aquiflexum sp. TaxID=1872584 RepID=UPI0035934907